MRALAVEADALRHVTAGSRGLVIGLGSPDAPRVTRLVPVPGPASEGVDAGALRNVRATLAGRPEALLGLYRAGPGRRGAGLWTGGVWLEVRTVDGALPAARAWCASPRGWLRPLPLHVRVARRAGGCPE
jgi:hypothetical protein